MKKIFFWFCFLCMAGVLFYFLFRPAPPAPEFRQNYYADFLPDDTVAVVGLYNMKGLSEDFPDTAFGQFLSKPVIHEMLKESGATDQDLKGYDAFYDIIADLMTNPVFRQIFGDDAVIALCPPDPQRLQENPEQELKNALVVFGTSSTAGPISKIARLVMRKDVTNARRAGLGMTRVRLNDKEMLYGYDTQGVIVLAYEPNRIVQAVQQKTTTNNLQHFSSFTKTKAFWQEAKQQEHLYARSYFNAILLHKLLNTLDNRKMQEMVEKLAGVESIGGLIVQNHGKLRLQMETERDSSLNENAHKEETVLAHENLPSPLLQKTTLLHYRTSGFNKTFFRNFLPSEERKQLYRKLEKSVQNELGFSLDKFLEAIGPRAEISVHEIINAGMLPLPKTVLAFQVQDRKAAGWALKRLRDTLKKQGVAKEHQERVQGHDLYYWTVMPVEATHLAIVLTDTMLYIANGESQLRALLSEKKNSESRAEKITEPSKIVGDCITTANAGAFLFRPARFADQIAPVADWLTDMMLARGTGPGKKTQKEVLTLMRSFDRITACSHRTATGSRGEVVFKVFSGLEENKK